MDNIPQDIIKLAFADLALDDCCGLYEMIWQLNAMYPDLSETEKISSSIIAVRDLVSNDIIEIYKRNWDTGKEDLIAKDIALQIIENSNSWSVPSDESHGDYYCFGAAGNGDAAHGLENELYKKVHGT